MPLGCPIQDGDNNDCQEDEEVEVDQLRSPFTDALILVAEKCFGQRFGFTCTKNNDSEQAYRLDKGSETGDLEMALCSPFSDSIMGTWIQWRQSCMGHQLPIKYVYFFM